MGTSFGAGRVRSATCSFALGAKGAEDYLSPFLDNCLSEVSKKLEGAGFVLGRLVLVFRKGGTKEEGC